MLQVIPAKISKQILALLRDGDFAHPGEIEAIDLAMRPIPKNPTQKILDVGCGLGGTANYLRQWGDVTAIDINADMITYVHKNYPDVKAMHSDVMQVQLHFTKNAFQLITLFSAFFCFPKPAEALQLLSQISDYNGNLIIFDYATNEFPSVKNPFTWSDSIHSFNPIFLPHFEKVLDETGWQLKESRDISTYFIHWYEQLIEKFELKKALLLEKFNASIVENIRAGYVTLLDNFKKKQLGGLIVYATKK